MTNDGKGFMLQCNSVLSKKQGNLPLFPVNVPDSFDFPLWFGFAHPCGCPQMEARLRTSAHYTFAFVKKELKERVEELNS